MDEQRGNKTHQKKVCDLILKDDNLPNKRWVDEKMDGRREREREGGGGGGGEGFKANSCATHIT